MSPILVRPVREQLEHDRVIRLLPQELGARKVEVAINPGAEQNASVGTIRKEYPDAVLYSMDKGRRLVGVVEVETGESVNNLEAMAQWAHLSRLKVPFHLYVPMGMVDVARRLSADNKIQVAEIWSYHHVGDQLRFTLIHRDAAAATLPKPTGAARAVAPVPAPRVPVPVRPALKSATKPPAKGLVKANGARPNGAKPNDAKANGAKAAVKGRPAVAKAAGKTAPRVVKSAKPARSAPRPASRPALGAVKSKAAKTPAKSATRRPPKPAARSAARNAKRK